MEASATTTPTQAPVSAAQQDCLSPVVFSVMLVWITVINLARSIIVFTLSAAPKDTISWPSIFLSLGQAAFVGVPIVLLAFFWRNSRYRSIFRAWALAAGLILWLIPMQLFRPTAFQSQMTAVVIAGILYLALLRLILPGWFGNPSELETAKTRNRPGAAILAALAAGIAGAYPWLALGALGSILDTLLAVFAALVLGLIVGGLVWAYSLHLTSGDRPISLGDIVLGGLAAAVILNMIGGALGLGFGGLSIFLMLALPAWGMVVFGLSLLARRFTLPNGLLVGLLIAAPLALIDPDELALVISFGPGEILSWALQATGLAILLGLFVSVIALVIAVVRVANKPVPAEPPPLAPWATPFLGILAGVATLIAIILYTTAGQPGFYGEHMFVILNSQADLSPAVNITDPAERRAYVYRTLVGHAQASQAALLNDLDRLGFDTTPYYLVNAIEVTGDPFLRTWLKTRPEVDRVIDSPRVRPLPQTLPISPGTETLPEGPQWNQILIGADRVWEEFGVNGEGVVVGQSDSGAEASHPELADSYRGRDGHNDYNWYDPWNHSHAPQDFGGHGTHTLGTIIGKNTGIAPGATWFACANLARNLGAPALYLDCMQFMLAPFPTNGDPFEDGEPSLGANVINNSWGCPDVEGCDPESLLPAIRAMRTAGIFVVASGGNDGPACETLNTPPALYDEAYSVGAIDQFGQLASFSSLGPVTIDGSGRIKPDIVAPGVNVFSSMPGGTYGPLSGTSMAGPHLVGVVALIWSANPDLIGNIDRTEDILNSTAKRFTGTLPNCPQVKSVPSSAVGYGLVDAYAAVQMALEGGE